MRKKSLLLVTSILLFSTIAYAQQIINFGQLVYPFNARTLTGSAINSSAYTLPTTAAGTVTWAVAYGSAPSSITLQIQGSLDNSSWTTIDSTTSTSATSDTASIGAYRFIRARVNASSGGTTITVNFSVKSGGGASSGAAGGGLTDAELRATPVPVSGSLTLVGDVTPSDTFANPTTAVPAAAFEMVWNGTTWTRALGTAGGFRYVTGAATAVDNFTNPSGNALVNLGMNFIWDGSAWDRWTGAVTGSGNFTTVGAATPTDNFANPTTANLNQAFNMVWDGSAWDRWTGLVIGADTPANNFSNPTNAIPVMALNMCFDGSTWDMCVDSAIPAGTNNIGDVDVASIAAGDNNIGNVDLASAIPAGTNLIGQTTPASTATTTNSLLECNLQSAASTNSTNCKNGSGNLYGYELINTTATLYYLRLYNTSSAPTCSSATGFIRSIPIPASATGAGVVRAADIGVGYATGISFCLTGGPSSTDNTNAATGVFINLLYK